MQKSGSVKRHITYEEAASTISTAMSRWTDIACSGGSTPAMQVDITDPVACDEIEYNRSGPNANTWIFRDDGWPYDAGGDAALTLALTTVTFNAETGEILDADVEINSADNLLTAADQSELAAVATHEAGHVFGLAHSANNDATMYAYYSAQMAATPQLDQDDVAGMCAAYPPGTEGHSCDFAPEGGFTAECYEPPDEGCGVTKPGGAAQLPAAALFAAAAAAVGWSRRRRR